MSLPSRSSSGPKKPTVGTRNHAYGEPGLWYAASGLVLALAMLAAFIGWILYSGVTTFWPGRVVQAKLHDGSRRMGEIVRFEYSRAPDGSTQPAWLLRTGNFELTQTHFTWVRQNELDRFEEPSWAWVVERVEWGRFYGIPKVLLVDDQPIATEPETIWTKFNELHPDTVARRRRRQSLQTRDIGDVNARMEEARLSVRAAELRYGRDSAEVQRARAHEEEVRRWAERAYERLKAEIESLEANNRRFQLRMVTADGREATLKLGDIVRAYPANRLDRWDRVRIYLDRWREYLTDTPREANSEGGIYPAIVGTVSMCLLLVVLVAPIGVLTAVYLREYARPSTWTSLMRIAISNLAAIPSIVYGVFGLGFFCYTVGAALDQWWFPARLPNPTYGKGALIWASLTLAVLTLPVVIVTTEEALAAIPNSLREGSAAFGATRWQTIRRIVLPRALPGILTGMILALARGAGEVAPLMLVGAVKLAPELPVDGNFPWIHLHRSFMHLGFHTYDLGFQSPNSEAAKPMVYTTAMVLVTIIVVLNLLAIGIRNRIRSRFISETV